MIGIVAAIGDEATNRPDLLQQGPRDTDIVDVAGRQQQSQRPAQPVAQRVELARPGPARLADRLEVGPLFPPLAERCALMWVLTAA